jgi:hypothetical protein
MVISVLLFLDELGDAPFNFLKENLGSYFEYIECQEIRRIDIYEKLFDLSVNLPAKGKDEDIDIICFFKLLNRYASFFVSNRSTFNLSDRTVKYLERVKEIAAFDGVEIFAVVACEIYENLETGKTTDISSIFANREHVAKIRSAIEKAGMSPRFGYKEGLLADNSDYNTKKSGILQFFGIITIIVLVLQLDSRGEFSDAGAQ